MLGTRIKNNDKSAGPFKFITYKEVQDKVEKFAAGLSELGMKKHERLGCYSQNREEATVAELACWTRAFTTVYLYDTLGDDAAEFVTNHAEVRERESEKI